MTSLAPPEYEPEPPRVPALLLRKRDAAAALGIGVRTLDKLVADGEVCPVMVYSAVCFDPRDLRLWIDRQKTHSHPTLKSVRLTSPPTSPKV